MDVEDRKKEREVELRMWGILKEILRFVFFVFLVLLLAYIQRDPNQFYTNRLMKTIGFEHENIESVVRTQADVWTFVSDVIDKGLIDENSTNFFLNERGIFMSRPRLRQWRIKPGLSCRSFVPTVDCKPRLDDMKFLETRRFPCKNQLQRR